MAKLAPPEVVGSVSVSASTSSAPRAAVRAHVLEIARVHVPLLPAICAGEAAPRMPRLIRCAVPHRPPTHLRVDSTTRFTAGVDFMAGVLLQCTRWSSVDCVCDLQGERPEADAIYGGTVGQTAPD